MQDRQLYQQILGIGSPVVGVARWNWTWRREKSTCTWSMRRQRVGAVRSAAKRVRCTIINPSVLGVIWTPVSTGRCCTRSCHGHVAKNTASGLFRFPGRSRMVGSRRSSSVW